MAHSHNSNTFKNNKVEKYFWKKKIGNTEEGEK